MRADREASCELVPVEPSIARLRSAAALLRTTFGDEARYTETYLRWQYADNPDGQAVGFDAYIGEVPVAHYVALPLRASVLGRSARGLLSLNTATAPAHQGKGLFTRLAMATYARGRELGYDFVIGVANANSTPGFVRKLGFQLVCPLDVRVGIGRPRYETNEAVEFHRTWSDEALRWRLANPVAAYALRDGALWADAHIPGISMYLGKAAAGMPRLSGGPSLRPLTGWIGAAPNLRWLGLSLPVPQRLRPSPLNFIFLDLGKAGNRLDPSRIFFEALDFDAY
jgi:GNAT superfamily N-acetyltransferase